MLPGRPPLLSPARERVRSGGQPTRRRPRHDARSPRSSGSEGATRRPRRARAARPPRIRRQVWGTVYPLPGTSGQAPVPPTRYQVRATRRRYHLSATRYERPDSSGRLAGGRLRFVIRTIDGGRSGGEGGGWPGLQVGRALWARRATLAAEREPRPASARFLLAQRAPRRLTRVSRRATCGGHDEPHHSP
jgi:hypothetical protein